MAKTTNYQLEKPAETDFYDINKFNDNMDIIDSTMKSILDNSNAKSNKAVSGTVTLMAETWDELESPIGEYTHMYNCPVNNITGNDIFNGSVSLTSEEAAQDCGLAQYAESDTNIVRFYAKARPSSNITINYNYMQGV